MTEEAICTDCGVLSNGRINLIQKEKMENLITRIPK